MAVTDEAIGKIKDMLIQGELKAGDRLPPEKELSERLGLSRSSLREAVKALELTRVLDVRRGDGTYVTSLDAKLLNEAVAFVVDLHQDRSVLELFEVRRILEPATAHLAAGKITAPDIARLRDSLKIVDEYSSVEELVAHDLTFHGVIAQAAGNDYLGSLVEALYSSTIRARIWQDVTRDKAVTRALDDHRTIVDALERGDAELVKALVTVHISNLEKRLRRTL
ncbi:FadR family transcriptional regulator [Arthrobacter sp. TES]|uniref:FadR family transcriptional regulator n=1 Tax=Paenarthrobacter ureafaciens TaxID=37931 RepID=A0AAX3EGT3_PAEUR|nr:MULTISPECIES: FadR/GntR family transcriptional regulator [Paenarthrobacter]AOY73786.1 GntR family transcriptional regulator [Arthrobacter sp. ZXY-2]ERI36119.1 GntR family transcriptional regulator [Arthrobacter sp. AK-YN10]NKR11377.1 GntR family transcriptional regulator [Arthrobacter sp. M5]NKR14351.1 GntR family transcriptional regulator [Arthrobacter sp. M6]OEH57798.1 GntR family transcriptional regulator [Arthrobacter sp. D2]OEH58717.1 GntR family transcriptional regulator [Arthrobacte